MVFVIGLRKLVESNKLSYKFNALSGSPQLEHLGITCVVFPSLCFIGIGATNFSPYSLVKISMLLIISLFSICLEEIS